MSQNSQHTPTPWPEPEYDNHGNGSFSEWWDIPGVARVDDELDAKFIVRAANAHDAMLAALHAAVNWFTPPNDSGTFPLKEITEAIAMAEGHTLSSGKRDG